MIARKEDISGSYISYFSTLVKTYGGINLAQGIPGFNPPDKLLEILSEIQKTNIHQYAPGTGNIDLLNKIRKNYQNDYNKDISDFFVVTGATEAISLIYTYLNRKFKDNFNVMAFSPAYESYTNLPKIFGNKLYLQDFDSNNEICLHTLENNIKQREIKLLFLCSPGNPWGKIIDKNTLNSIIEICTKYSCYLIVDAVYSELYFNEEKPYYPTNKINEYIFYVNSFSKLFSITGWRIGYFLCSQTHFTELKSIHDYIGLSSPAPLQVAIAKFMDETEEKEKYVSNLRKKISDNFFTQSKRLLELDFELPKHDGGFFIWAKCPAHITSGLDFGINLYNQTKTAIIPGIHFGNEFENYIRINIALPKEILEEGITNICNLT
jgi:aminotransferase